MAGWSIYVCPKCHTQGTETGACPNGCTRAINSKEAHNLTAGDINPAKAGDQRPIQCIGIDVVPTDLATVALISASTSLPVI